MEVYVDLLRRALWVSFIIGLPILGAGLVVGILISIIQAVTSIQDMTLTFVPKLLVLFLVLLLAGGLLGQVLMDFSVYLFQNINLFIK
jgi:flagellar biosynthetic protein FliQ